MTKRKPVKRKARKRKVLGFYVQEQHVTLALNGVLLASLGVVMVAVFAI